MKSIIFAAVAIAFALAPANAQSIIEIATGLKFCRTLKDDALRLKCFDGLFAQNEATETKPMGETRSERQWNITETKSPLDDSPEVAGILFATSNDATLMIRCKEKKTEAAFSPARGYLGSDRIGILTRFDDSKPIETRWNASTNGQAAFAPGAIQFIAALRDGGKLFIRATGYSQTFDGEFNLMNVSEVRAKIAAACKWPNKTN